MSDFTTHLKALQGKAKVAAQNKPVPPIPAYTPRLEAYPLSPGVVALVKQFQAALKVDTLRYIPTPDPGVHLHPDSLRSAENTLDPAAFKSPLAAQLLASCAPLPQELSEKQKTFGAALAEINIRSELFPQSRRSRFSPEHAQQLGLNGQLLYRLLSDELEAARQDPDAFQTPVAMSQKIQKALGVYLDGRAKDALVLLSSQSKDAPHNRMLAFMRMQMLFARVYAGQTKLLPEARDEAKKATLQTDNETSSQLLRYRYHHCTTESYFDADRAAQLLTHYNLCQLPAPEASPEEQGIYVKSMLLLAQLGSTYWTQSHIEAIAQMATAFKGGGALYVAVFQPLVLPLLADPKAEQYAPLNKLEINLHTVAARLERVRQNILDNYEPDGTLHNGPKRLWTISNKAMQRIVAHLPLPTLSDLLMDTSLDGQQLTATPHLDQQLREHGLQLSSYWGLWFQKTAINPEALEATVIPDEASLHEASLLPEYEQLLTELRRVEDGLIDAKRWELCHFYQASFSYDRLAEAGLGQLFTAHTFTPETPTPKKYYKAWSMDLPEALRPSQVLETRAKNGSFADIYEIQTLFNGCAKILEDPKYGIAARQQAAWEKYRNLQDKQKQAAGRARGAYIQTLMLEFWWFFFAILPASVLIFMVIASSKTLESGLRMGAMLGIGSIFSLAIVYMIARAPKPPSTIQPRYKMDADGNLVDSAEAPHSTSSGSAPKGPKV